MKRRQVCVVRACTHCVYSMHLLYDLCVRAHDARLELTAGVNSVTKLRKRGKRMQVCLLMCALLVRCTVYCMHYCMHACIPAWPGQSSTLGWILIPHRLISSQT